MGGITLEEVTACLHTRCRCALLAGCWPGPEQLLPNLSPNSSEGGPRESWFFDLLFSSSGLVTLDGSHSSLYPVSHPPIPEQLSLELHKYRILIISWILVAEISARCILDTLISFPRSRGTTKSAESVVDVSENLSTNSTNVIQDGVFVIVLAIVVFPVYIGPSGE